MNEQKLFEKYSEIVKDLLGDGYVFCENTSTISNSKINTKLVKNGIYRTIRLNQNYSFDLKAFNIQYQILIMDSNHINTWSENDSDFNRILELNYYGFNTGSKLFSENEALEMNENIIQLRKNRWDIQKNWDIKIFNPSRKIDIKGFKSQKPNEIEIAVKNSNNKWGYPEKSYLITNLKTGKMKKLVRHINGKNIEWINAKIK